MDRRVAARDLRKANADTSFARPFVEAVSNGDEVLYASKIGNFSKGLKHNALGEPDLPSFASLVDALDGIAGWDAIQLGGGAKLVCPRAGKAFTYDGPDSHHVAMQPSPVLASEETASEMAELYWTALMRDVPFYDWGSDQIVADAAADLDSQYASYEAKGIFANITPSNVLRGLTPGDSKGPFISQFLMLPISMGTFNIDQTQNYPVEGVNYLTELTSWLAAQNGNLRKGTDVLEGKKRLICTLRDLAHFVHFDQLFQPWYGAALILSQMGAPTQPGLPYAPGGSNAKHSGGGPTWGLPHLFALIVEAEHRALKAAWFSKWYVNRKLRPEELGGRVHQHISGAAVYPLHANLVNSTAVQRTQSAFGTCLLPQAYPEGCPLHPSYPAGHATVAGASATILKAWFSDEFVFPVIRQASADGSKIVKYTGADASKIKVSDEIEKLASNIAVGRQAAGIHYRSDDKNGIRMGEAVAIQLLQERAALYEEQFSISFTSFDGDTIVIGN